MEEYAHIASELIDTKENYSRAIGKIAVTVTEMYGSSALKELSELIREMTGRTITHSTLRNYRWVYETTHKFNLPEDITYTTLQLITSSGRPEYWADKITKDGLSSGEVAHAIREEKGMNKKLFLCPECGKQIPSDQLKRV